MQGWGDRRVGLGRRWGGGGGTTNRTTTKAKPHVVKCFLKGNLNGVKFLSTPPSPHTEFGYHLPLTVPDPHLTSSSNPFVIHIFSLGPPS